MEDLERATRQLRIEHQELEQELQTRQQQESIKKEKTCAHPRTENVCTSYHDLAKERSQLTGLDSVNAHPSTLIPNTTVSNQLLAKHSKHLYEYATYTLHLDPKRANEYLAWLDGMESLLNQLYRDTQDEDEGELYLLPFALQTRALLKELAPSEQFNDVALVYYSRFLDVTRT